MLQERTLRNHYNLSDECGVLTRALCHDDDPQSFQINLQAPGLPRLLADYHYAVSAWPLIISSRTKESLGRIVREAPSLIKRGILRFYEGDLTGFTAHYHLPDSAYQLLSEMGDEPTDIVVRHDLVLLGNQAKILEVNVGSKCGGWQVDWLWAQFAELISRRSESRHWKISHTPPAERFLRHVRRAARTHVGPGATGNVLILIEPYYMEHHHYSEALAGVWDGIVAAEPRPGRLLFDTNLDGVAFDGEDGVTHRGVRVDCIANGVPDLRVPAELVRGHVKRRLFYPDNRLHTMLGDKRNFALLHALKAAGRLSEHDASLVDDYIPWAANLTDGLVDWEGQKVPVQDVARTCRKELVLKRGLSRQGKDVFVGCFLSDHEWASAIERAGSDGQWLLQAYCPSDRLYAPDPMLGITEHQAVWGVFGFGKEYGGAFGRLMTPHSSQGIINSARGAKETVILEV